GFLYIQRSLHYINQIGKKKYFKNFTIKPNNKMKIGKKKNHQNSSILQGFAFNANSMKFYAKVDTASLCVLRIIKTKAQRGHTNNGFFFNCFGPPKLTKKLWLCYLS